MKQKEAETTPGIPGAWMSDIPFVSAGILPVREQPRPYEK